MTTTVNADARFEAEAAAGLAELDASLANDTLPELPALEYMRGYLAHSPDGALMDTTMRGWLDALIGEVERLRNELLDLAPVRPVEPPAAELTPIEVKIFRYLRNTVMSTQEIAAARFVSLNTVKTHTKNIYAKLGVNSRAELRNMPSL